jgi:hypothetical protein
MTLGGGGVTALAPAWAPRDCPNALEERRLSRPGIKLRLLGRLTQPRMHQTMVIPLHTITLLPVGYALDFLLQCALRPKKKQCSIMDRMHLCSLSDTW